MPANPDLLTAAQAMLARLEDGPSCYQYLWTPELAALRAAVDAAKAAGDDKARLNWWLKHQWVRFAWIDDDVCNCIELADPSMPYALGKLLGRGTNERTAIDVAMAAEGQGEGK